MAELREKGLLPLTQQANQLAGALQGVGVAARFTEISSILGNRQQVTRSVMKPTLGRGSEFSAFAVTETTKTNELTKSQKQTLQDIEEEFRSLAKIADDPLRSNLLKVANALENEEEISKDVIKSTIDQANALIRLNQISKTYAQTSKKVTEATSAFLLQFAPSTKSGRAIIAFDANMAALNARLEENRKSLNKFAKETGINLELFNKGIFLGGSLSDADAEQLRNLRESIKADETEKARNNRIRAFA